MPIHILPDSVASQIAAGEVVERPVSVVKELLENSLDAKADHIEIRIEQAGKRLIEVADNGLGIPASELKLAVARHATSKLTSADDLFRIQTLGFRGEALASIASVSRFQITSRVPDSPVGAMLRVDAGLMSDQVVVGAPVGTLVQVKDLFFNVPARLKFLKTDLTERQVIDNLVFRYALAYSSIRFKLFHDGKQVIQTSGNQNHREILAQMYGVDIARQMLEVQFEEDDLRVSGFISPIALTRSNRREITFFVNGRWIHDNSLNTALLQAYHTLLMVGRFPLAALFLSIPPEDVDVNVHPAKAEVRFRSQERVFSAIQRAVSRSIRSFSPVPPLSRPTWQSTLPTSPRGKVDSGQIDIGWQFAQSNGKDTSSDSTDLTAPAKSQPGDAATEQTDWVAGRLPLLRLVGQIGGMYLVAEGPDGLYLIDQHAAHERVLYETMTRNSSQGPSPGQKLLEPVLLDLSDAQTQMLTLHLPLLNQLGFEIELFGRTTFRIRAVPVLLNGIDPVSAVRAVVEDFEEDETPLQEEEHNRLIARICKRAAVKAGKVLPVEEQKNLLSELEKCESPRTCPHGRPTMIHLSVDLLARQFGRRGSR